MVYFLLSNILTCCLVFCLCSFLTCRTRLSLNSDPVFVVCFLALFFVVLFCCLCAFFVF